MKRQRHVLPAREVISTWARRSGAYNTWAKNKTVRKDGPFLTTYSTLLCGFWQLNGVELISVDRTRYSVTTAKHLRWALHDLLYVKAYLGHGDNDLSIQPWLVNYHGVRGKGYTDWTPESIWNAGVRYRIQQTAKQWYLLELTRNCRLTYDTIGDFPDMVVLQKQCEMVGQPFSVSSILTTCEGHRLEYHNNRETKLVHEMRERYIAALEFFGCTCSRTVSLPCLDPISAKRPARNRFAKQPTKK